MIRRLIAAVVFLFGVADCFGKPDLWIASHCVLAMTGDAAMTGEGCRHCEEQRDEAIQDNAIHVNNLALGTPSSADTVLNREGYALGYSEAHEQPLWVTYELTREEVKTKKVHRSSVDFQPDPEIPTESAQLSDYRRSGYDRGHMAPAADMRWSAQAMKECFYLSNICPQERAFNAGIWADLEQKMRHWANCYGAIWIVTGPVFEVGGLDCFASQSDARNDGGGGYRNDGGGGYCNDDAPPRHCEEQRDEAIQNNALQTIGANKVTVPTAFYKVVYVPSTKKGIGFLLPHRGGLLREVDCFALRARNDGGGGCRNDDTGRYRNDDAPPRHCEEQRDEAIQNKAIHQNKLKQYAVSIDAVEAATGLDFFSALPDGEENLIESTYSLTDWKW